MAHSSGSPEVAEIRASRISFLGRNPPIDRGDLFYDLAEEKTIPINVIESLCRSWISEEPENPEGYATLARIYGVRNIKPSETSQLARRALELALPGNWRRYGDAYGKLTELLIPMLYEVLANSEWRQQHFSEALQAAKTAQILDQFNWTKTRVTEGRVWLALGQGKRAEAAFRSGWKKGSEEAKNELRALYERRTGNTDGFEAFLNSPSKKPADAENAEKTVPAIQVKSLDGNTIRLAELRGKIVVINFWSTGCAPCRGEIPELNKLVQQYKGKNVVFIALATDEDERIVRTFLKEVPYAYQIVINAGQAAAQFGVPAYPTHFVVDQNGRIAATMVGSNSFHGLNTVIEQLLR